jgi:hypothetical protein
VRRTHSEAGGLDHCFEVFDELFERELDPVPVGQPAAAPVLTDERVEAHQHFGHGSQTEPPKSNLRWWSQFVARDERRTGAAGCVRDVRAVAARPT